MNLYISPTGVVSFIWDDALVGLRDEGQCSIRRASHVEPTEDGQWTADMSPVDGPLLGPFDLRSAALLAERLWLEGHGY